MRHVRSDEGADVLRFFDAVDRSDVRMIQGGKHLGFALEAGEPIGIERERLRQNLQRDVAV